MRCARLAIFKKREKTHFHQMVFYIYKTGHAINGKEQVWSAILLAP